MSLRTKCGRAAGLQEKMKTGEKKCKVNTDAKRDGNSKRKALNGLYNSRGPLAS